MAVKAGAEAIRATKDSVSASQGYSRQTIGGVGLLRSEWPGTVIYPKSANSALIVTDQPARLMKNSDLHTQHDESGFRWRYRNGSFLTNW